MSQILSHSHSAILGNQHNNYINSYLDVSESGTEFHGGKLTVKKIRDPTQLKRYGDFPSRKIRFPRYLRMQPYHARAPLLAWRKSTEKELIQMAQDTVPRHQQLIPINEPRSPRTRIHPSPLSYTNAVTSVCLQVLNQDSRLAQMAEMSKSSDFYRSSHKFQRIKAFKLDESGQNLKVKMPRDKYGYNDEFNLHDHSSQNTSSSTSAEVSRIGSKQGERNGNHGNSIMNMTISDFSKLTSSSGSQSVPTQALPNLLGELSTVSKNSCFDGQTAAACARKSSMNKTFSDGFLNKNSSGNSNFNSLNHNSTINGSNNTKFSSMLRPNSVSNLNSMSTMSTSASAPDLMNLTGTNFSSKPGINKTNAMTNHFKPLPKLQVTSSNNHQSNLSRAKSADTSNHFHLDQAPVDGFHSGEKMRINTLNPQIHRNCSNNADTVLPRSMLLDIGLSGGKKFLKDTLGVTQKDFSMVVEKNWPRNNISR